MQSIRSGLPLFRPALLSSAIMTIVGSLATVQPSFAQESLEEITVTGSRIVRRDFEANSPIMTVDRDLFENTGSVGIETVMNQLPQFVPAVTQFTTGDVQTTATNTPGASTISLRGLGTNRNLVLIDGRRAMPINASGATDINMIPSSALQRVETISGGASSTYGADAMAGVVNFILRTDYEGFELDAQTGMSEQGDGETVRLNGLFGANFADGGGNVLLGFEVSRREEIYRRDRDFYTDGWADRSVNGTEGRITDPSYNIDATNRPTPAAFRSIFGEATTVTGAGPTGGIYLNTDGSVYRQVADGAWRYNGPLETEDGVFRKLRTDGTLQQNQMNSMLSIPLERYSMFGKGTFDITDDTSAFFQTTFSQNTNRTWLIYSPASGSWSAEVPYGSEIYAPSVDANGNTRAGYMAGGNLGLNCGPLGGCTNSEAFPVTPELATLLNSRPNPNAPWQLATVADWADARSTQNRVTSYQMVFGFEGNLPIQDWTWDASVSYGATDTTTRLQGFAALERYRAVISSPNYGRGFFYTGNTDLGFGNGFGGGRAQCSSGLPVMQDFIPSQDCVDAVSANMQNYSTMEQRVGEANMQGRLMELPAGEARFAAGLAWRDNRFEYQPDQLQSQNSFLDSPVGVFPASYSRGETEAAEIYGELLVPVLAGLPFVQELNLELGYRITQNDPSPNVDTWKALVDWSVTDALRLRGGFQVANRAPNIGELFLSRTQTLTSTTDGDYCSERNPANPLSANPAVNPNAAQVRALCEQLMGVQGASEYYAPDNDQPQLSSLTSFINLVGNPNLENETADTFTLGAVVQLADRLSLTLDYYRIEISDMISAQSESAVYRQCMDPALNAGYSINHPACQRIVRNPNSGATSPTDVTYSNEGALDTSGVDVQINYGMDLWNGTFNTNFMLTYLDKMETRVNPVAPWRDWVGTFGPNDLTGVQGGSFDYRTFTTFSYFDNAGWNLSLRWQHLPSISSAAMVSGTSTVSDTKPYDKFDLSGGWSFGQDVSYQLRFGIDNLLDEQPEITGRNLGITVPTSGVGSTNSNFYDVIGRNYFVGFKVQF